MFNPLFIVFTFKDARSFIPPLAPYWIYLHSQNQSVFSVSIANIPMFRSSAIKRWSVISIARIRPILQYILLHLCKLVADTAERFMHVQSNLLIPLRRTPDCSFGDVISAHAVPQHHVQWRRRATLLVVRCDAHTTQTRSSEQQAFDFVPVAVVVEVDGTVRREEGVKILVRESVRVSAFMLEYQEVRDVDYTHTQARCEPAQHGRRFDDFEGEFGSDADYHDLWVKTVVRASKFPNRSARAAMIVGLFWGKEDWLRLLRADHQIHVVSGAEAMGKGREEGVGIRGKVHACGARFEVQNGADEGRVLV